jgi:hypothetical protein
MRESRGVELLVKVDAAESFIQVNCDPPAVPRLAGNIRIPEPARLLFPVPSGQHRFEDIINDVNHTV